MIIAIGGYARVGKDEAAKGLQQIGFKRVAFADKLREFLYTLNPMVHWEQEPGVIYPAIYVPERRLQDVIDEYGWDGYKTSYYKDEIRGLLQRLGTECGREIISDTIWIDAALDNVDAEDIVIPDCRFLNEAKAVKDRGGYVVRINRPGVGAINGHVSETSLDNFSFDYVIVNDGTVEDLHYKVQDVVSHLRGRSQSV